MVTRGISVAAIAMMIGGAAAPTRSPADPVSGIWEVCLRAEETRLPGRAPAAVAGYLTLTPLEHASRWRWMYLGRPSHYGTYHIDLQAMGIGRAPRVPVPLVGARVAGDSVVLVLDPFGSHGPIVLHGLRDRGEISGPWAEQAYALGAHGTFRMRRISEDDLPLPYPVDGPLTAPSTLECPEPPASDDAALVVHDTDVSLAGDSVRATAMQLQRIHERLGREMRRAGAFPASLAAVTADSLDVWGSVVRMREVAPRYEVRSAGADRRFETADDVVVIGWPGRVIPCLLILAGRPFAWEAETPPCPA